MCEYTMVFRATVTRRKSTLIDLEINSLFIIGLTVNGLHLLTEKVETSNPPRYETKHCPDGYERSLFVAI
jgi:hypothetical protein